MGVHQSEVSAFWSEMEQQRQAFPELFKADGTPATGETRLRELHPETLVLLRTLPKYQGVYYYYELAKRAEILQQYLLQASAYFRGFGGFLGAVQRANDPSHIVLLVWQSVLWAIHCQAWHLTRMRTRGQPQNIDYWIPDRPILEPNLEPQPTLRRLREHLTECWQWYELLERTVLDRAQGVVYIKKRMEAVRMAYLAAAYASVANVPTSFDYDQPVPIPGSLTFVFPEPPPSASTETGDEVTSAYIFEDN